MTCFDSLRRRTLRVVGQVLGLLAFALAVALPVHARAQDEAEAPAGGYVRLPCHAVTPVPAGGDNSIPEFTCSGEPRDYQSRSLWYRIDPLEWLGSAPGPTAAPSLMVHISRYDAVSVWFRYADGDMRRQSVRSGDFGSHWRAGGQIAFDAPQREVAVTDIFIRFDKPAAAELLRLRLLTAAQLGAQSTGLAVVIGAALTLLAVSALYNFSLSLSSRKAFSVWQACWAVTMLAWGAVWSQLALITFPGIAGAASAQLCTALACFAIAFATFSAVTAIEEEYLARVLRLAAIALGICVGLLGIPLSIVRSGPLMALSDVLGLLVLADIVVVALCLHQAWRRGSPEARVYTGAWALPMLVLALVQFVDIKTMFWGGGSQIVVLCAATWQTLWLSIVSSQAHGRLRTERDIARKSAAQARELARRDPLTGLRNRRGLIDAFEPMLVQVRREGGPLGLLVVDIDKFKSINDSYGHEAGDEVLVGLARRLSLWEGQMCKVARLGGEEFALVISGLEGFALTRFADSVRRELGACDHAAIIGERAVTVSIGVAQIEPQMEFRDAYRLADEALYAAKDGGRDRVMVAPGCVPLAGKVDGFIDLAERKASRAQV
ncbi:diguanylate cyclase [Novosphingobium sp. YJ-S2-02]|uniref:diguanylate cyclase n=1 Tax=Novosphingobium aureum TaxID=2792964 RepID=A0A931HEX0_9SPHN|nr:GGDEF domain-containing protein [Novosphingobium aureum]MBH0114096.1 diguanylate cyclase [Novosphingobium aureum]